MLSWSVISDLMACGPVSYSVTISSDGVIMTTIMTTDTSYDFTGLTPGTNYNVSIEPSNMAGSGQAYTKIIRTAPNGKHLKGECKGKSAGSSTEPLTTYDIFENIFRIIMVLHGIDIVRHLRNVSWGYIATCVAYH